MLISDNINREYGTDLDWKRTAVTNWSLTEHSLCDVCSARGVEEIRQALDVARARGLSIIAHGAGHSYTDAALNGGGLLIDLTTMRRILAWDPERGIMRVEPGVTVGEVARVALRDRWWLAVTPSTAVATVGGCVAMNVNGKNSWTHGSFGEHVLSLTVLLAGGQLLTVSPTQNSELFRAVVGSAGLLGFITSITLQLKRVPSDRVEVTVRPGRSLRELFQLFEDEQAADYLEAWVDGFAAGGQLGRGIVTASRYSQRVVATAAFPTFHLSERSMHSLTHWAGTLGRPFVEGGVRGANSVIYRGSRWPGRNRPRQISLMRSTYYAPALFTGYRALLPGGSETFQAFVPAAEAEALFAEILRRSQEHKYDPLWCIIKRHRRDPFLLGYQVDGFSLEVNYRLPVRVHGLRQLLRELMEQVIAAGGRFYLAKDALLTPVLYRRSVGEAAVAAFLDLKQRYDPERLLQSNLYRRVFQPSPQQPGEHDAKR
ncbi:FAD-binding oxidoreductase [Dictyobacter aurantiacus]|uniref:Oxidoreductase n=1 Tax=Dictyobacter aurantiacus TaxID=1936993 RepID=A0A401ZJK4_9CHLR|nr:FAD-binding oxidoreductase [Dictyobacter aurantiacus]GCE07031.1 oxidoreductase [Dictyobacter aurantiacus]